MYKRNSLQESIVGGVLLIAMVVIWIITGSLDDWWILSVFGIFFLSSAAFRMVRLRNELQAIQEAEAQAEAEAELPEEDGIAAARALKAGQEQE